MDKPKNSLENVCKREGMCFQTSLFGNHYCRLCFNGRKVECSYLGEKDDNGFYLCIFGEKELSISLN